jgi:hypothetical protein
MYNLTSQAHDNYIQSHSFNDPTRTLSAMQVYLQFQTNARQNAQIRHLDNNDVLPTPTMPV